MRVISTHPEATKSLAKWRASASKAELFVWRATKVRPHHLVASTPIDKIKTPKVHLLSKTGSGCRPEKKWYEAAHTMPQAKIKRRAVSTKAATASILAC